MHLLASSRQHLDLMWTDEGPDATSHSTQSQENSENYFLVSLAFVTAAAVAPEREEVLPASWYSQRCLPYSGPIVGHQVGHESQAYYLVSNQTVLVKDQWSQLPLKDIEVIRCRILREE